MSENSGAYLLELLLAYPALPCRVDNSHEFWIVSERWLETLKRVHLSTRVSLLGTTLEIHMRRIRRHATVASGGVRPHNGESVQRDAATVYNVTHVTGARRVEKHTAAPRSSGWCARQGAHDTHAGYVASAKARVSR